MLWFRNIQIYRLAADHTLSADAINTALTKRPFVPCSSRDAMQQGWIAPAAHSPDVLAYAWQNAVLVSLQHEEKILPGAVVKRETEKWAAMLERAENRQVGKREKKEIREQVIDKLLERAFTRQSITRALIDLQQGLVLVDASSAGKAEMFLSLLRESLGSLPTRLVQTQTTPQTAMTLWLESADAGVFDLAQECALAFPGDDGAKAKLTRQPMSGDEVQQHLAAGKLVTQLALSYQDRVAFVLTDKLELKRVTMMDTLEEELKDTDAADREALFNTGLTLLLGETRVLVPALFDALSGEMPG